MTKLFHAEFEEAARRASRAVDQVMREYRDGELNDEDDITPWLAKAVKSELDGKIDGLRWKSRVLRHRKGIAGEENAAGADLLIHYRLDTPRLKISKGVLVQAKRSEATEPMSTPGLKDLKKQCRKMLNISPASFVWNYATTGMRCGSALRVNGLSAAILNDDLDMTPFGFFSSFLKCPIGDETIKSHMFDELSIPSMLEVEASRDG